MMYKYLSIPIHTIFDAFLIMMCGACRRNAKISCTKSGTDGRVHMHLL